MTDHAVNEWTREDLPDQYAAYSKIARPDRGDLTPSDLGPLLDAVVEHLNAHHPKPPRGGHDAQIAQLVRMCNEADLKRTRAEDDVARLRRAHEIVEGERDLARDERDQYRRSGDEWKECHADAVRERDEWKARAEAAEARTAPAVTKADIEKAIRGKVWAANREPNKAGFHRVHVDWATDAVWSLVSGDDPAVFVVRESDVAAVEVERDSHGEWFADGEHVYALGAADSRNLAVGYMQKAIRRLAVARAIEQDADPVDELAGQIESATRTAIRQVCDDLADVVPSLDPLAVERAMEVTAASRKVAAHVLGQEVNDGR